MPIYRIADLTIEFEPYIESLAKLAEPYRIDDGIPDIKVELTREDIQKEKEIFKDASNANLVYTAIYRKICTRILDFDAFVFHSSAIVLDGEAYLFTAVSGTGKSTHTSLWLKHFGDRAFIINDDKPIVRFVDGQYRVYGTPWCGKDGINRNTSAPIKAVCFLHRGASNSIKPKSSDDALVPILNQAYRPFDEEYSVKFFNELERFMKNVSFYDLYCNISDEAVEVSYNGMK